MSSNSGKLSRYKKKQNQK